MWKQAKLLCTGLCILNLGALKADSPGLPSDPMQEPVLTDIPVQVAEDPKPEEIVVVKKHRPKEPFSPFTGKVKGKKVRMRLQPDIESPIVRELEKGEYLAVVGDAEEFWVVESPSDLKAYVFRSFVLDNQIEGNRVNVRLHPSLDAPVVAHLNAGDPAIGTISSLNNKWLEISVPATARFYVAKDYLENCGGPQIKTELEGRQKLAEQQLELAEHFTESEMQKSYPNIDFDKVTHNFHTIIQEYHDFPHLVKQAENSLAQAQEQFLDKRIDYLEAKSHEEETQKTQIAQAVCTDKMKLWEPIEDALYARWADTNRNSNKDEYYEEQKLTAVQISGILEPYLAPVKCKPGDYILRQNDLPVAYVYSTVVNLQSFVGKQVVLMGAARPNNNFAFPAYFVFSIEN